MEYEMSGLSSSSLRPMSMSRSGGVDTRTQKFERPVGISTSFVSGPGATLRVNEDGPSKGMYAHCRPTLMSQSGLLRHAFVSVLGPMHGLPPFDGGGLLHSRLAVMTPGPHGCEHSDHEPKFDQPPSTGHGAQAPPQSTASSLPFFSP